MKPRTRLTARQEVLKERPEAKLIKANGRWWIIGKTLLAAGFTPTAAWSAALDTVKDAASRKAKR